MGVVYRAYDTLIKREVALKTIRDHPSKLALQLFYKECDVKPYFVMPLLSGMTLDKLIKTASQRLTVERSVEIIAHVCRGLHAAHERGLVHRDLKPSNIFVMEDDSVKIIDFGLLTQAQAEFPGDAELSEMERIMRQHTEARAEAQRLTAQGQEPVRNQRLDEGIELLRNAYRMDYRSPLVRAVLLDSLVERAAHLLDTDWAAVGGLIQEVLQIDSDHARARSLRSLIEDQKREEYVEQCVAHARRLQASGDLAGALARVEEGLVSYPYAARLTQLSATLRKALGIGAGIQRRRRHRG